MKIQIRPVFFFAVCISALLPIGMLTAQAKAPIRECSASPSKTQGHWSWRLIDGRKCWYAGKTVISKSLLKWPAAAPVSVALPLLANPITVDQVEPQFTDGIIHGVAAAGEVLSQHFPRGADDVNELPDRVERS